MSRELRVGLGVVAWAALCRAVVLWFASLDVSFAVYRFDEEAYRQLALAISSGDWLAGDAAFGLSPLWTYVLAVVYRLFGESAIAPVITQQVMGVMTVAIVYRSGCLLTRCEIAGVAAAILACTGPILFYETRLLADPLVMLTVALTVQAWLRREQAPTQQRTTWAFATLALAALARPNMLLAVPFAGAAVLVLSVGSLRERIVELTVGITVFAVVIAPTTFRNWVVADDPVLISASGPLNLYVGNGPSANGAFKKPADWSVGTTTEGLFLAAEREAEEAVGHQLTPAAVRSYWGDRAVEHIASDPVGWVRLLGRKLGLALHHHEIANNRSYGFERRFLGPLALPIAPSGGPLLVLGLVGVGMAFRRWRARWPLIVFGLAVPLATFLLFFVLGRYRLGWYPPLAVGACLALNALWNAVRMRSVSALGALVAAIALVAVPVYWPKEEPSYRQEHYLRAVDLHRAERPTEAIPYYEYAAENEAFRDRALQNIGLALAQLGRNSDAARAFEALAAHRQAQGDGEGAQEAMGWAAEMRAVGGGD